MSVATLIALAAIFVWVAVGLAAWQLAAPLLNDERDAPAARLSTIAGRMLRVLYSAEAVLATTVVVALVLDPPSWGAVVAVAIAIVILAAQRLSVRLWRRRRFDSVRLSEPTTAATPSLIPYSYILLEVIKVIALTVGATALLAR
jgi:hypothetical protein